MEGLRMKCYIVKDLLPNYIDKLTNEDINVEINTHLKECSNCRIVYEHMLSTNMQAILPDDKDIDFLKKLKSIIQRKYATIILLTCIILISFMIFSKNYDIPVSYDKEHMGTETYQAVEIVNPHGSTQWDDVDSLDFETTKIIISQGYNPINLIRLVRKEASGDESINSYGRTISRNGQEVRVVYYCYTQPLWNQLFLYKKEGLSTQITTGDIYGDSLYHKNYNPQIREIYYLPIKNMDRLEKLSDDEFDAQREKAILVWRGTI